MDEQPSFINVALPSKKKSRQIFVAYSYRLYPKDDYRKLYLSLEKAFDVKFIFADEKITNLHILQKICNYIRESAFGVYDISGWNPNVTLELGLALGLPEKCFIAINPDKTDITEVPADLRGVDRMEYKSYSELETALEKLIAQELPPPTPISNVNFLEQVRAQLLSFIQENPGLRIGDIAKAVAQSQELTQVAIRPMVDTLIRTEGPNRGRRYYPI